MTAIVASHGAFYLNQILCSGLEEEVTGPKDRLDRINKVQTF
jgi:hypothetical protein